MILIVCSRYGRTEQEGGSLHAPLHCCYTWWRGLFYSCFYHELCHTRSTHLHSPGPIPITASMLSAKAFLIHFPLYPKNLPIHCFVILMQFFAVLARIFRKLRHSSDWRQKGRWLSATCNFSIHYITYLHHGAVLWRYGARRCLDPVSPSPLHPGLDSEDHHATDWDYCHTWMSDTVSISSIQHEAVTRQQGAASRVPQFLQSSSIMNYDIDTCSSLIFTFTNFTVQ